jgi:hypothetical protein
MGYNRSPRTRLALLRSFIEQLEDRYLLANLHLVDAYLTDIDGNQLASVAVGQQAYIEVSYQTVDMPPDSSYDIRTATGGSSYTTPITGISGTTNQIFRWGPHLIGNGEQTLSVTLDVGSAIGESDETDNSFLDEYSGATFGPGFVQMLEGEMWEDWSIGNYVDVDLEDDSDDGEQFDGPCEDFRGGGFCYNGHNGWDINIPTWRDGYHGWDIYAAAGGTVSFIDDGHDDHNTEALGQPSNTVVVNHGGGWETKYIHLARESIIVNDGDFVVAGQKVAEMGSSGNSTGIHLHWSVYYNGFLVEPMVAGEENFNFPLGYSGDNPSVLGAGITSYDPEGELGEGASDASIFTTGTAWRVYTWAALAGIEADDEIQQIWVRPNGKFEYSSPIQTGYSRGHYYASIILPDDAVAGTWNVRWMINGGEKDRAYFEVQAAGAAQARIYRTDITPEEYIVDGRSSPLDFGTLMQNQTVAPTMSFRVHNSGQVNLTTSNLVIPAGFSLVFGSSLAANILPNSFDDFTVVANITTIGHKQGFISFLTNDPSPGELIQSFEIEADVLTPTDAVATLLGDGVDAIYIRRENSPQPYTHIWVNANNNPEPNWIVPTAELDDFSINTLDGEDIVTVDFRYGSPLHLNGLDYNGGDDADQLSIWGSANVDAISLYDNAARLGSGRVDYSNIEDVLLDGSDNHDTFTIGGPVGTRDLDADAVASISISGGDGNDILILNDQDDTGPDSYFITDGTFTKVGFGLLKYNEYVNSHIEGIILNANNGSNYIQVDSTSEGTPITISGGGGNDVIHLDPSDNTLDTIRSEMTVSGGGDTDYLYLWDSAHDPFETWQIDLATVTSTRSGTRRPNFEVTYREMELVEIAAGDGEAIFNIHSTYPTTPVTINAGKGDDFFFVTPIGQNLGAITAELNLRGEGDDDWLSLDDRLFGPPGFTINTLTEKAFTTSHAATINYDSVAQIVWQGSETGSFTTVSSLPNDIKVELYGRGGVDSFLLGSPANGIADLGNASVSIDGGAVGGADSVGINDQANTADNSYTLTATTFDTDGFGLLSYDEIESFTLSAASGDNVISIPSATANTTIHAGAGDDTVTLGAGNLGTLTGNIAVNGNADTDRVILEDSAFAALTTYTLNFPGVGRPGFGGLGYGTVEDVILSASNADSTINVNGTGATTNIILRPNNGADLINVIETHVNTPVTILPSAGGDTVMVNSDNAGFAHATFTASTTLNALQLLSNARASITPGNKVLRTNSLSLAPTATLEIADNSVIVQATAATRLGTFNNVRNWIKSARNTLPNLWAGPGITSANAAANPGGRSIGHMLNSTLANVPIVNNFANQAVDQNSILLNYTLVGDVNLDRQVTIADFLVLSAGFGLANATWQTGDVNFDDAVTIADFLALSGNFGQAFSGDVTPVFAQSMAAASIELTAVDDDVLETSDAPKKTKLSGRKRLAHHHQRAVKPRLVLARRA